MWPPLISGGRTGVWIHIVVWFDASMWPPLISGGRINRSVDIDPKDFGFKVAAADQRRKESIIATSFKTARSFNVAAADQRRKASAASCGDRGIKTLQCGRR